MVMYNLEMAESNGSLQTDEVQALSAIFESEWAVLDSINQVYCINITNSSKNTVQLQVTLPESYPLHSPPIYEISAPWMSRTAKKNLCSAIEDVYCQNIGQSIIYLWIDTIKKFIEDESLNVDESMDDLISLNSQSTCETSRSFEIPSIEHGEPIIDRKSVFQAHGAKVVSVDQVYQVLNKLKENRKIASATHNIFAYRISQGNSSNFIQDCDDDGETKAGSSLLHLMQIVNASDVLVVVSRWYGGIHLGPDRFKHIKNAARNILSKLGFIDEKTEAPSKKTQKK